MLRSSEGQRPLREEKKRGRATRRVGSRGSKSSRLIDSVNDVAAQGSRNNKGSR